MKSKWKANNKPKEGKSVDISITELRHSKNISQKKLGTGLCYGGTLSEIESGRTEPDYFLLQALVERCGNSLENYSVLISMRDHQIILERHQILQTIRRGFWEEAEDLILNYEKKWSPKSSLHRQYGYAMRGLFHYEKKNNEESLRFFEMAIKETQPEWNMQHMKSLLYSSNEIRIICCIFFIQKEIYSRQELESVFTVFLEWNETLVSRMAQSRLMIQYYPQYGISILELAILLNREMETMQIMEQVFLLQEKEGAIGWNRHWNELLQIAIRRHYKFMQKNYSSISKAVMERKIACGMIEDCRYYEQKNDGGRLLELLEKPPRRDLRLLHEVFAEGKIILGFTQAQMELTGLDRSGISKILRGVRIPREKTSMILSEQLKVNLDKYDGYVETSSSSMILLADQIMNELWLDQCENITGQIMTLEEGLDLSLKRNREYLKVITGFYEYRNGGLSVEALCHKCEYWINLSCTNIEKVPLCSICKLEYTKWMLLSYTYVFEGESQKAIKILDSIKKRNSVLRLNEMYRYQNWILLYVLSALANMDSDFARYEEDIKKGFQIIFRCEDSRWMAIYLFAFYLGNRYNTLQSQVDCRVLLHHAYNFSQIYHQTKIGERIQRQMLQIVGDNKDKKMKLEEL